MPTLHELRVFVQLHLRERAHDHPAADEGMGVVPLGYEPRAFEQALRSFDDRFDLVEEGWATYRGVDRPIFSVSSRTPSATRRLLVLSGVHGNEQAGIVCVPEILERLVPVGVEPGEGAGDCAAGGRVAVRILTPVNPVGAAELSRFNAEGYDVNRDFVRFRTEEARVVRRTVEAFRPDFVVSLHEGPQDAAFLFANRHVDPGLARRLLAVLEAGGTELAEKDYFGLRLRPRGLSASSPAQRAILSAWAATLKMMAVNEWAARRGIPEITLESSWRSPDRDARVRAHVDLVLAVRDELART